MVSSFLKKNFNLEIDNNKTQNNKTPTDRRRPKCPTRRPSTSGWSCASSSCSVSSSSSLWSYSSTKGARGRRNPLQLRRWSKSVEVGTILPIVGWIQRLPSPTMLPPSWDLNLQPSRQRSRMREAGRRGRVGRCVCSAVLSRTEFAHWFFASCFQKDEFWWREKPIGEELVTAIFKGSENFVLR